MVYRKLVLFLIVLLIILGVGYWWYHHQHLPHAPRIRTQAISVTVAKVKTTPLEPRVDAVGVLQALHSITITTEIAGEIKSVNYQPGALVKQGDVLFRLDDRIYAANLKSSLAALQLAAVNYRRSQQLAKIGVQAKQTLDTLRADYLQAQAKVMTNKTYLSQTVIQAPFEGYVGDRNLSLGDFVQPGQALTTLTDRKHLRVTYQLSEGYLPELALEQTVVVKVPKTTETITGKVSYIAPLVDPNTHSVTVQAKFLNPDNRLSPGMFVHVSQTLGKSEPVMVIPQQSVIPTITGAKVFVVRKGKAYSVNIQTGLSIGDQIEVEGGLKVGDVVVTAGQALLQDGAPVKEVNR